MVLSQIYWSILFYGLGTLVRPNNIQQVFFRIWTDSFTSLCPQPFWQLAVKTNESTCPHLSIIHFTHPLEWVWEGTHFCPIIGWQGHVLDSKCQFQWMLFVNAVCNVYTTNGTKWNCNPFQPPNHQLCMFELWLLSIQKMDCSLHAPGI